MNTIYKYELESKDLIEIGLPRNATVISAGVQGDSICIWVEVDTDEDVFQTRYFEVFGTGHEIASGMGVKREFIQTIFMGWMVFHVYERLN